MTCLRVSLRVGMPACSNFCTLIWLRRKAGEAITPLPISDLLGKPCPKLMAGESLLETL